jgi:hypothetical protein
VSQLVHSVEESLPTPDSQVAALDGNANEDLARLARMLQVVHAALAFAEGHGFDTYDISDVKGTKIVLWTYAKGTLLARLMRLAIFGGLYVAPVRFRKLLGVKVSRYPHASAMLASAYIELSQLTSEELWALRARSLLEWLTRNRAESSVGECWGASFPWYSYGGATPTTVGNAHGTVWVANAFFSHHQATRNHWSLEHAIRACDFLLYGLNSSERPSGSLAISYTVLDRSQCINVNADSASILIRLGNAIARQEYCDAARKMVRFVIETQNPDGSWYYDEPVPGVPRLPFIDGFHTGMVLSALTQIVPELQDMGLQKECKSVLDKGLTFYLKNLFTADGRPFYALKKIYPIDPYACGQGIVTLIDVCQCHAVDPHLRRESEALLHNLADQTLRLMLDSDGSFFTARYRFRIFRLKSLRWAQAVLALAFTRYSRFLLSRLKAGAEGVESVSAETRSGA